MNKNDQILALFVSKIRPKFLMPFTIGGTVYATDGAVMMAFLPADLVEAEYSPYDGELNVGRAIPAARYGHSVVMVADIHAALAERPLVDDVDDCPTIPATE